MPLDEGGDATAVTFMESARSAEWTSSVRPRHSDEIVGSRGERDGIEARPWSKTSLGRVRAHTSDGDAARRAPIRAAPPRETDNLVGYQEETDANSGVTSHVNSRYARQR